MVGQSERRALLPRRASREAATFAAVVALLIDAMFYLSLDELSGTALTLWGAFKVSIIVAGLGWIAYEANAWSFGLAAAIFALIGLEETIGVTAPLGLWLIEESGIRRGPQGANTQLLRRVVVMSALLAPTLYSLFRAPRWLRPAMWTLVGLLAAVFTFAVLGDTVADRVGTNLDEVVEEPLLSASAAFVIGLAVEWNRIRVSRSTTPIRQ